MGDKIIAVMGVGPGLGAAIARRFAREGFAAAIMARHASTLEPVREQIEGDGGRVLAVEADATSPPSVAAAMRQVRDQLGAPDVFVYNAGAFEMGGILEVSPEDFERCWRANCMGAFLGSREVVGTMLERGAGTILFTGATAAVRGSARFALLAVGKFGLRALAQSMARELGPRGIHVAHVIIDGQIDTPRVRRMQPDREDHTFLDPDRIADQYWNLHAQDRTAWTLELDLRPAVEGF